MYIHVHDTEAPRVLHFSAFIDQGVIRQIVQSFYERKEYPPLSGVLEKAKEGAKWEGTNTACCACR